MHQEKAFSGCIKRMTEVQFTVVRARTNQPEI